MFVSNRTVGLILIVEDNCDNGFVDSCLPLFVHQFGEVTSPNLTQVGNSEDEANRVQDIGFSGAIQSSDGIEMWIKAR